MVVGVIAVIADCVILNPIMNYVISERILDDLSARGARYQPITNTNRNLTGTVGIVADHQRAIVEFFDLVGIPEDVPDLGLGDARQDELDVLPAVPAMEVPARRVEHAEPLASARMEIREETTLTEFDLV